MEEQRARELAQRFHETYERLAPSFGYETRKESAVPWERVPERNRNLMIAVCTELLAALPAPGAAKGEDAWLDELESTDGDRDCLRSVLRAFAANQARSASGAGGAIEVW